MKILSWNYRGITHLAAIRSLRALIRANAPDVFFLFETKSLPSLVSPIMNHLGFYLMTHVAPVGSCGGLVLAWRAGVELESFITNKNNISFWCLSDPPTLLGYFLVYIALQKRRTKLLFGTLSLLLVRILLVLGFP
jgi:hypothetical protein